MQDLIYLAAIAALGCAGFVYLRLVERS